MADDYMDGVNPTNLRHAGGIDAICEEFSQALRRGERPEIRYQLGQLHEESRPELFRRLLTLQLSLAAKTEDRPGISQLMKEYPEYAQEVIQVVSEQSLGEVTVLTGASPNTGASAVLDTIQRTTRYRMEGEVARGGMGAIHLAEDPGLRRRVAVKTMLAPKGSSSDLVRFIEEAQITGQLDHPGIVPVYELGVNETGDPFYSMKFVHGRDLHAILKSIRTGDATVTEEFQLHRLLTIFDRVCDAMAFAHAHGVIHRDLKPANIRIGEFGEVLVMDWGLARLVGQSEQAPEAPHPTRRVSSVRQADNSGSFSTMAGSVMGSPQYMAPEQAAGAIDSLDARTDIFALGAILYEILTLRPPFEVTSQTDIHELLERVAAGRISPIISTPRRRVPEALAKVTLKALALAPDDRYQSVGALQREINAWLGGFATEAENAGFFRQVRLFIRRNKGASLAAAVIALLLVVGSVVNLHQRNVAVDALAQFEESERQKDEQARKSAPAYLKSALVLEQQGQFDDAITATEGALRFDPDLSEGYRVLALLLARAGRWEEAQEASSHLPEDRRNDDLRRWVEEAAAGSAPEALRALAKVAGESGMPSTGAGLMAQSARLLQGKHADTIPLWRAKLEQAWGIKLGSAFGIDPEWGLSLGFEGRKFSAVADPLAALQGIPLESVGMSHVNVTDLSPLKGMPLRRIHFYECKQLHSLEGLEGAPLRYVHLQGVGGSSRNYVEPLRGKKLDYLWLDSGFSIDTTPLSEIQCREITMYTTKSVSSLAFIRDQKDLRSITLGNHLQDDDWRPILECPTLEVANWKNNVNRVTLSAWKMIQGNDLEGARATVQELRDSIRNSACEPTRELLDLMEWLIDRRMGSPVSLAAYPSLKIQVLGTEEKEPPHIMVAGEGRAFTVIPVALRPDEKGIFPKVFENLGVQLASIRSGDELRKARALRYAFSNMLTGGQRTRKDPVWRWLDGSPWNFDEFAPGESDKPFVAYTQWQSLVLPQNQKGIANAEFRNVERMLIQFPVEWLEGAEDK